MSRKLLIINRIITLTLPVSDHLIHCVAGGGGGYELRNHFCASDWSCYYTIMAKSVSRHM